MYPATVQRPGNVYHVRRSSGGLHQMYNSSGGYYDGRESPANHSNRILADNACSSGDAHGLPLLSAYSPATNAIRAPVPTTYIACIVRTDQSYAAILVAAGWGVAMAVAAISVAMIAAGKSYTYMSVRYLLIAVSVALIVAIVRTC